MMTRHIVLMVFLSILALLSACSDSDDENDSSKAGEGDAANRAGLILVPLEAEVADALCSLTGRSTERDLLAIFGKPDGREHAPGMVLLRWKTDGWTADAMFRDSQLQLAGANARQPQNPTQRILEDHPTFVAGKTRLSEMEAVLGPGVRVGVQWQRGVEVARSVRNHPDFDRSVLRDRCSDRYAWTHLDMAGFSSLRFSDDGMLQGAL